MKRRYCRLGRLHLFKARDVVMEDTPLTKHIDGEELLRKRACLTLYLYVFYNMLRITFRFYFCAWRGGEENKKKKCIEQNK